MKFAIFLFLFSFQIHPELNTQGIALADLTQRAQTGQKHKLSINTSIRITPAKKRIKLEQSTLCPPAPKLINSNSTKHESDNSDYSHTTDDNRHSNAVDIDNKLTPIKSEPIDVYDIHQVSKKKMYDLKLTNFRFLVIIIYSYVYFFYLGALLLLGVINLFQAH